MAGMAMEPTAEKPVRNFPASIHLQHSEVLGKHTGPQVVRVFAWGRKFSSGQPQNRQFEM